MNKWTLAIGWLLVVVGTLWFSSYVESDNGKSSALSTAQRSACNSLDAAQPCAKEETQK